MHRLSAIRGRAARTIARALALVFVFVAPFTPALDAQVVSAIVDITVQGGDGGPLASAGVVVTSSATGRSASAVTGADGRARIAGLAAGDAIVLVRRIGYAEHRARVVLSAGTPLVLRITLHPAAQQLGSIRVVSLRGDLTPERRVDREQIAAIAPHDASSVLRELPGTDAMRRGALALDPVVRGLRDTQLGVYVDAARTFPGGPAGMDTPMSHVDPAHVQSMEVITGPYALTWGAGNLSAIRVTTQGLPDRASAPAVARISSGYDGNLNATELSGSVEGALGRAGRVRYVTGGAWRSGDDYTAGDGSTVAARFRSAEGRTRVGLQTSTNGTLSVLGSFQAQRDVDFPGRPLDATFFDTYQVQAEYALRRPTIRGTAGFQLRDIDALAYLYDVDHLMDNDDKPTALPDPTRMPPFATDVNTISGVRVRGGRFAARFTTPADWDLEMGGDIYDADHDASRTVKRRDTGVNVRQDLIWGGARIVDAGLFTRVERPLGRARLGVTGRVDFVYADADTASPFFVSEYGTAYDSRETNLSGAATVRLPVSGRWTTTVGLGSVVRTAEANERFSDRAAAKRAQTNAEFLGDPSIRPERSTQADLWLEGRYARTDVQVNLFVRRMDDYITLDSTSLPRAQPGSAPPVFRFVNGRADFHGGELLVTNALTDAFTVGGSVAYLYGEDRTIGEPALGVTPLRGSLRTRYAPPAASWFGEAVAHVAGAQERVATVRGELPTAGFTTFDVQGGYRFRTRFAQGVQLRVGVRNLLDRAYVQHLSAINAFGGGRLYEPGRVLFLRLSVGP